MEEPVFAVLIGKIAVPHTVRAADEPRTVRLGFLHSFGTWLVPGLIRRARDRDPGIGFELYQGAATDVTARVRRGELDLGVVAPRPDDDGITWRLLQRQGVQLAVPLDHPLAGERAIWVERLREETFISMAHGYGIRHVLDEVCAAAGFTPTIALECQELATVAGLVSAGIGVGLLPDDDQTNSTDGIRLIPLRDNDAHREIGIVWRRGAVLPEHVAAVRDLARS
jgi:DNA-binding transcriptional LysR family regulator